MPAPEVRNHGPIVPPLGRIATYARPRLARTTIAATAGKSDWALHPLGNVGYPGPERVGKTSEIKGGTGPKRFASVPFDVFLPMGVPSNHGMGSRMKPNRHKRDENIEPYPCRFSAGAGKSGHRPAP